mmetsp:Transcript_28237/g.58947  ORF Transcript_28237/g.58947 Transcript_28237/m.58947 type:complete len:89 (+) Transcript_28237:184-450(+)
MLPQPEQSGAQNEPSAAWCPIGSNHDPVAIGRLGTSSEWEVWHLRETSLCNESQKHAGSSSSNDDSEPVPTATAHAKYGNGRMCVSRH